MSRIDTLKYNGFLNFIFILFLLPIAFLKNISLWDCYADTRWLLLLSVVISLILMCFLTVFTVFPNTALFISLKKSFSNHFWLLLSVPCSYLCTASAMLLDWTRLSCALFLALVHHPMPDSELLYVLHSFSCHRDYTQVSLTYQKSFFRVRTADCCVTLV